MIIMIFDVPAEHGGALSILNQYYDKAVKDDKNSYIFVLSIPKFEDKSNIKIMNFPWIKKSWFHRLYFDRIIAPKLVKKDNVDEVISLQNTIIPRIINKQTVYLHQPLPFIDKKYRFFENKRYWLYQNIIGILIKKSLKKADKIIVQSNWLKEIIIRDNLTLLPQNVLVEVPKVDMSQILKFDNASDLSFNTFFYPASSEEYKNHKILVYAVENLNKNKVKNFKVILTINFEDLERKLQEIIVNNNLPFIFLGRITRETVFKYYSNSILLFPSTIETFGLPLLEARESNCVIIALKEKFSEEILTGYKNAYFFDYDDVNQLEYLMNYQIEFGKESYQEIKE